jgi:hypothetical protein
MIRPGNMKGRDYFEGISIDGRIIEVLELLLRNKDGGWELLSSGSVSFL